MSLKVYNGYLSPFNLESTINRCISFKDVVKSEVQAQLTQTLIDIRSNVRCWTDEKTRAIIDAIKQGTIPNLTVDTYIFLYPCAELTTGTACSVHACSEQVETVIVNALNLKDFKYWNNTDPDNSVPEYDWDNRGIVWETIYNNGRLRCSDAGVKFEFTDNTLPFSIPIYRIFNSEAASISVNNQNAV